MMQERLGYFMGKPVEDMTREELLDMFRILGRLKQAEDAARENEIAMWRSLDRIKPRRRFLGLF